MTMTTVTTGSATAAGDDAGALRGVDVGDLRGEYERRGLGEWSDRRLIEAVADVVVVPRADHADSFVLHAPLELAARAALMPRVAPRQRRLARLHVLAIAAQYEAFGPPVEEPAGRPLPDGVDPSTWLLDAITAGDPDEAARAAQAVGASGAPAVVALLDAIASSTAAAGHAPIFLYHLDRGGARYGPRPDLLRPLARELARQPDWHVEWVDRPDVAARDRSVVPEELAAALAATPAVGVPGSTFIHPLMSQVDRSGLAASLLADTVGAFTDDAARVVLRAAARSMLAESCEHAPYGWTHCLTMPQALLGLAGRSARPARLLALAATEVVAFRAALGVQPLPTETPEELPLVEPDALATAAATAHDAHVVKYVLACLDAAAFDPAEARLYLAAGQRLLDCWDAGGGDPSDPLR
jgi:hypothetical protein